MKTIKRDVAIFTTKTWIMLLSSHQATQFHLAFMKTIAHMYITTIWRTVMVGDIQFVMRIHKIYNLISNS